MDAQRAEVCALEAEIAALRRACEEPRAAGEDAGLVQKSLREIYPSDSEGWASSKDLQSHLEHLESELLFLSTLTGINIRNYSMKTEDLTSTEKTEKSIKKVLQKHRLSGNCHMITFQLEFEILEIQNKESLSSVITDLNIIMEPTEYSELSEFVSRAEERRDLLMFFRSLRFFVEWCDYRKRTFQHLKDKYPEVVHLPEGAASSCMGVRSACQPGFELVVVWRMHMEEEGKVFPKLDLLPKVPQQALELDQHHILETAPLRFRTLLGVLGIEAALESLITSLCPADNQFPANTQVCDFIPHKELPASREKPRL
ncbi:centromere protein P isoform X1 [Canis lupus familiaris]|uniref:Centromere protein P n=3 Tax=Canis lupus TaxID=9612 RepID=A0A8C0M0D6_CANLF|nr:centromere protein P isoform X1 [Canis lupus dingo]XP_038511432.1 centromere protein P isoform X1 [Canis lupus familiaris]XP_533561.2 centromere protein P isoform X1 [Canis lupus familiaris]|eukprot:XP_533561.2 centromere protein P isoform X1 [Canis lupus familiaris]